MALEENHGFSWKSMILRRLHSVSKETHYEFMGFLCDPGSWSSDIGRVMFDHGNLIQVAKKPIKNVKCFLRYLDKSMGMSYFGVRKTAQTPLHSMQRAILD